MFSSCKKEDNTAIVDEKKTVENTNTGMIQLGRKLENPYSVSAFKEVHSKLAANARISTDLIIEPTHFYVRFLPNDYIEFEKLKNLGLVLFDYPIDHEITEIGAYYHDPSIPADKPTWQYCVVKVGFTFPNIKYEKLDDLYLFDIDAKTSGARTTIDLESYEVLEEETFKLTGNELNPKVETGRIAASCGGAWKPEATIRVFDDARGVIPVEGVKVRFNRWFESYEKPTDAQGVARCLASFRREVNFTVIWETEQDWFDLRHGNYGQSSFKFADQCGNANYTFHKNSFYWPYALTFNAAWYYYTHNGDFGIKQPPTARGVLNQRLHIGIHNSEFTSPHYFHFSRLWQSAQVDLYYKDGDDNYDEYFSVRTNIPAQNSAIFPTVIHEIAHASHWEIYNLNSEWAGKQDGGRWMAESWADAVSIYLTRGYYGRENWIHNQWVDNTEPYDDFLSDKEHNNNFSCYSALYEDLIDDFNQSLADFSGWSNTLTNNLSCPTDFRSVIKNSYAGMNCMECRSNYIPPSGTSAFTYPNQWGDFYQTRGLGADPCPGVPVFDGANCWVMDVPPNTFGYVKNNLFYTEAYHNNI